MPLTDAERARSYRKRRGQRLVVLEAETADLSRRLDTAEAGLEAAHAEIERLAASQCRHPAGAVDGGHCHACGQDVW